MGGKTLLLISIFLICFTCAVSKKFWDFSALDIKGKNVKFSSFKGKVLLVVNVASECGFTDAHYKALVKAKKYHGSKGDFEILAFPCNQFSGQEPKENADIAKFVKETYKVNFPMFSKINVKGDDVPDFWQFLNEESGNVPDWNFWKYLVDENGNVVKAWGPSSAVEDVLPDVIAQVKKAKATQASVDKIKQALKDAQAKMGGKTGGLNFQIRDDL